MIILQVILMVVQEIWIMSIKKEEYDKYIEPPSEKNNIIKSKITEGII